MYSRPCRSEIDRMPTLHAAERFRESLEMGRLNAESGTSLGTSIAVAIGNELKGI